MRGLVVLALVLLAAAAHFAVVGLEAHRKARAADRELSARIEAARALADAEPVVSHLDLQALQSRSSRLVDGNRRGLAALLDTSLAGPAPSLDAALRESVLTTFDPLHQALLDQGDRSPEAAAALARVLTQLNDNRIRRIRTLELESGGEPGPVPGVEGVEALGVALAVEAGLQDALALLESLAPGAGEPVLAVRQAGLAPVDPGRWDTDLTEAGPPVRLTASLAVLFAAPAEPAR